MPKDYFVSAVEKATLTTQPERTRYLAMDPQLLLLLKSRHIPLRVLLDFPHFTRQ